MALNYYDDKGNVLPELFVERAEDAVEEFKGGTSKHQLRKFYNQVLLIRDKIEESPDEEEKVFKRQLPYFRMIISKANYARARRKINKGFCDFLEENISNIEKLEDFKVFVSFFESVVAYGEGLR